MTVKLTIEEIANWKEMSERRDHLYFLVQDWEGISSTGIIAKNLPRIQTPHSLGVPISLEKLKKIFPELVVESEFD